MQKDKIRLAIIGCGGMARAHLNAYIYLKNQGIDPVQHAEAAEIQRGALTLPVRFCRSAKNGD